MKNLTIKALKKIIADLPDDMEVAIQSDPEGNGYWYACCADPNSIFGPDGDVLSTHHSAKDNCMEEREWRKLKNNSPRVLLIAP